MHLLLQEGGVHVPHEGDQDKHAQGRGGQQQGEASLTQEDIPRLDTGSMAEHMEDAEMSAGGTVRLPAHKISTKEFVQANRRRKRGKQKDSLLVIS